MSQRAASAADRARAAGVLVPLFALRGGRDWGIGEIGHLPAFCGWLAAAGHRLLQLLPIGEMAPGERSPYAAMTAFAIDPIYVSLEAVEDFVAAGGEAALDEAGRAALATARAHPAIDYDAVRAAKRRALELAFAHFSAREPADSPRAAALARFRAAEAGWLEEYALFRTLKERRGEAPWRAWEAPLRDCDPAAVDRARRELERERRFHAYVQWIAAEQWAAARLAAAAVGVRLKGDLPFMVAGDSADVWVRQEEFRQDAALGAPPDVFNAAGQDWGLPVHRWEVMEERGFGWLRARAARAAALFDAVRVDHVVGFYRMYVIPGRGAPAFVPAAEGDQLARGERLLGVMLAAAGGTRLIAEDLGVVPPFVRHSLARLGIPGYRVLRWEDDAGVFRDPGAYPTLSVATTGTHDTSSLAAWWEGELAAEGRRSLAAVPCFASLRDADAAFTPAVHEALLDGLYGAASDLVVVPLPDAYGGRERINVPATVGATNWAYRAPWTVEQLAAGAAHEVSARLARLAARHGR